MSFEPLLAFLLVRYLRKSLRKFSPDPKWDQLFTFSMYGIIALFILEIIFKTEFVTRWIWYALLFGITALILKNRIFDFAKKTLYAVLPLILLGFLSDFFKIITPNLFDQIKTYIAFAFCVAITWMIAMLVKSNKQQKALETERKKTKEEEERSKFIAAQKDKLEILVNERTAELVQQKEDLQHAIIELRETQAHLIQSEKMASLGELTAGIAHEIQNPLNFVNNFSEINTELIAEMKNELSTGNRQQAIEIANDIIENEKKINYHGKRADAIVKGMLQHSRKSTGTKEPTDINALADEYLRLSYHGLRAKDKSFNAKMETAFDESIGKINVIPQDIGRVLLNLFNNAFYACTERSRASTSQSSGEAGSAGQAYQPTVSVKTSLIPSPSGREEGASVIITVSDNGNGIPKNIVDKIFQPFFTTKPTGEGTGLGLSLSYDIVKAHGGKIKVESQSAEAAAQAGEEGGTTFEITLPTK